MIIFHHFLNDIQKISCKLKKKDEKQQKMSLKKWYKVKHLLLYHFLNDEIHTQIVSPGMKKLVQPDAL